MNTTNISEITTLSELLEKVEEYKATTSHLRIAHPGIDEISWEISNLPKNVVYVAASLDNAFPSKRGDKWAWVFSFEGCYIHAVSVPVE